ncbi:hypothetical protein Landi51_11737 [Colletotrichum acutatum]
MFTLRIPAPAQSCLLLRTPCRAAALPFPAMARRLWALEVEPEVRLFSCRAHPSTLSTILTDAISMSQRNHLFALLWSPSSNARPPLPSPGLVTTSDPHPSKPFGGHRRLNPRIRPWLRSPRARCLLLDSRRGPLVLPEAQSRNPGSYACSPAISHT